MNQRDCLQSLPKNLYAPTEKALKKWHAFEAKGLVALSDCGCDDSQRSVTKISLTPLGHLIVDLTQPRRSALSDRFCAPTIDEMLPMARREIAARDGAQITA